MGNQHGVQGRRDAGRPCVPAALPWISAGIPAALLGIGWAGLRARPAPFPAVLPPATAPDTMPLPTGLPAPVARFYRRTYGAQVPVIHTAVISGRGWMRLGGLTVPLRFRFNHQAGQSFRAYIELTVFGLPVMRVNEHFVDGVFTQEGAPGDEDEEASQVAQSAALRMWAEALTWFPAVLVTDSRVCWAPIDEDTALLAVPFGEGQEHLIVRFDPFTGEVRYFEAMKYRQGAKELWINASWFEQGRSWASWQVEERVYNVPVDTALAVKGA